MINGIPAACSGSLRGYQIHEGPKRLFMNGGALDANADNDGYDHLGDQVAWLDYHLRGRGDPEKVIKPAEIFFDTGTRRCRRLDSPHGESSFRVFLTAKRTLDADACIVSRLCEVTSSGISKQLNFGARKLSLRNGFAVAEPVISGTVYNIELEYFPIFHTFEPGSRLRITVSLSDYPFFENSPYSGCVCIYTGEKSFLKVPYLAG